MGKYHYEYEVMASNLCYGGLFIGRFMTLSDAEYAGKTANRGAFVVRKVRVYN